MITKFHWLLLIFLMVRCTSPNGETNTQNTIHEEITINGIGYDPYSKDCHGGIYIHVKDASFSVDKVGEFVFLQPSNKEFILPDGLIASGKNNLKFYGNFKSERCINLMGDGEQPQSVQFFVYDSIHITCPYKYFNIEKMEFDSQTCGRHKSFHKKIKIIE